LINALTEMIEKDSSTSVKRGCMLDGKLDNIAKRIDHDNAISRCFTGRVVVPECRE
jgi:hypothetical protein